MNRISGIYKIENITNGHIYIGSSNNINKRVRDHFGSLKLDKHANSHLQNAYNKYGKDSFECKVLIICDPDMLLVYEQRFIDAWNPVYNESNIAGKVEWTNKLRSRQSESMKGKQHGKGCKRSDEHKKAISNANKGNQYFKGHKLSEEANKILHAANKGNQYRKGHKASKETRDRISVSNKGHDVSKETRKAISIANKGKVRSDEIRSAMSVTSTGKLHSDITKRKISESLKKHYARKRELESYGTKVE